MAPQPDAARGWAWLAGRKWYALASLGLLVCALLLQPGLLLRLSSDNTLHPNTLLSITFMRVYLVVLAGMTLFWPDLADVRRRGVLIGLLILLALGARAVRLNAPYLDQHAHRQADVATMARNFYESNPNILWPQVNWQADGPNYVESTFPAVPWLAGLGYRLVGEQPWVGRGIVALLGVLGVIATFGLVSLYWGQAAGFLAALFLALSPMSVYFGRALIDDVPSLSLAIAGLWAVATWARTGSRRALTLGLIAIALAVLIKIVALYIYIPLVAVLWDRYRWQALRRPTAWAIMILPLLPNLAWYAWAHQIGQQYLTFGLGGSATGERSDYIAASKWGSIDFVVNRLFFERIGWRIWWEILTPPGLVGLILGVVAFFRWRLPGKVVMAAFLLATVLYIAISGRAQWVHNYYQLPLAASLAPFIGLGLAMLWHGGYPVPDREARAAAPLRARIGRWAALGLVLWLAAVSARRLPPYYADWQGWIPEEVRLVQSFTAPDDRVVTVTFDGAPTLLYHLHRPGWVVDYLNPEALEKVPSHLANGARVVILQDLHRPDSAGLDREPWLAGLVLVKQTPQYAIYRVP